MVTVHWRLGRLNIHKYTHTHLCVCVIRPVTHLFLSAETPLWPKLDINVQCGLLRTWLLIMLITSNGNWPSFLCMDSFLNISIKYLPSIHCPYLRSIFDQALQSTVFNANILFVAFFSLLVVFFPFFYLNDALFSQSRSSIECNNFDRWHLWSEDASWVCTFPGRVVALSWKLLVSSLV